MPFPVKSISISFAVLFFFIISVIGWVAGLTPFTCCKRAIAGGGDYVCCGRFCGAIYQLYFD